MTRDKVVALSGGIGGAKLALGLARVLPEGALTVIANTADDSEQLGLSVSPDIDTLMYTLAGLSDPERGWGRKDETWHCMEALEALGGEAWFRLGDRDLAANIERTHLLASGLSLTAITTRFCERLGVAARILPMSDDRVRTRLRTDEGWLDFQDYFVRRRCVPAVSEIVYEGADRAAPSGAALDALDDPLLRAIVICPSNPVLSIDPILSVGGLRKAITASSAPVIAVSPIIGGEAVKGPTAKLMREQGLEVSAAAVARRYGDLIDGIVLDMADRHLANDCKTQVFVAHTLMRTEAEKIAVAQAVLAAADSIAAVA
jgi:LPPG:FO 2-phospho-L-lactate transferase